MLSSPNTVPSASHHPPSFNHHKWMGPPWGQGIDRYSNWPTTWQSSNWGYKSDVTAADGGSLGFSLEHPHKEISPIPHHPTCPRCPQVWTKSIYSLSVKYLSCSRSTTWLKLHLPAEWTLTIIFLILASFQCVWKCSKICKENKQTMSSS